jgi:ribosomal-protein-alanine N-acetyltransferase
MMSSEIYLRPLDLADAPAMLELKMRNRSFFQPFEPIRSEGHYTLEEQKNEIKNGVTSSEQDQSYIFGVYLTQSDLLIGRIAITSVSRGVFQNAYLGYFIDQAHNGRGYATAAVMLVVHKAFEELNLHRLQAGVMPRNERSIRVLEKAGFRREGLAQRYLKINGQWEDHALFAITVEDLNE